MTQEMGRRLGDRLDGSNWPPLPLMENETVVDAPVDRDLLTKRYTEKAIELMEQHKDRPFFIYLPQAMPGMLTGTIIGMAQALGETAPLLMIGMVAFIVDIPGGPLDPSTVLPVQVYLWADSAERAFVQRTSAAIIVLLAFLIAMNTFAVIMRRRFERRW